MTLRKRILIPLAALATIFISVEIAGYYIAQSGARNSGETQKGVQPRLESYKILKEKNRRLKSRLKSLSPKGAYIVVDTAKNILYLKNGGETLREAKISSGSGNILEDPSGSRKWVFDTPRGEYSIQSKHVKPTWIKPDWAFIEEGDPLPQNFNDRVEPGVLGNYALGFGNGYFIHGTLYTRLLGRNVTHGCIRIGDEDLETLFKSIPIGAKLIIF